MSVKTVDVQTEYAKDSKLKPNDVKALLEWVNCQPHLPKITEIQAILFLQSCFYSNEKAKVTIDNYFTVKTICAEMFLGRKPKQSPLLEAMDVGLFAPLEKKTKDGYTGFILRLNNSSPDVFNFNLAIKYCDMVIMSYLYEYGTSNGHLMLIDMTGVQFGHLTKFGPLQVKKFLYYLQEAIPLRLKGLHYINIVPFVDKFLAIMKPFMKKELLDMLHLHEGVKGLEDYVTKDCLPVEYGGDNSNLPELHAKWKRKMMENTALFDWEDTQTVDESKRPGKPKNAGDFFGVEGTFKKLELD